jgi:carbonic anhydrase
MWNFRSGRNSAAPAACVLCVLAAAAAGAQAIDPGYVSPWKSPWTYQGERGSEHWAELDPQYLACRGEAQSPIDIRETQKSGLPRLRFEYRAAPIDYVINNGHTIRVDYAPGNGADYLIVGAQRFELTQFHFHHPSEESVRGRRSDMVVHLMHRSSDGEVAGVAILVRAGAANATVAKLWEHMPATEGRQRVPGLKIDPAKLLPRDLGYFSYSGSQTAPPCTEGVRWFVIKRPITLSPQQIAAFAALYPDDARPLQPLNGRRVQESR